MARLTDVAIANLKSKKRPYIKFDAAETGLGVKVTPAGRKIFLLQRIYPGSQFQTKRSLGAYPAMTLAEARAKAGAWNELIGKGIDPSEHERKEAEAKERQAKLAEAGTFAAVAEKYISWKEGQGHRRASTDARDIRKELVAVWGKKPIGEIKRQDVIDLVQKVVKRGLRLRGKPIPYHAKGVLGHAKALFAWAVENGLLENSPASMVKAKYVVGATPPRKVVLDDREIAVLWRAASRMAYPLGPLYLMLLLTAGRLSEVADARRSELHPQLRKLLKDAKDQPIDWGKVDDSIKLWTIPPERFKSDRVHIVPLSNMALAVIEKLPHIAKCDFLFSYGDGPVNSFSSAKQLLDARMLRTLKAIARQEREDPDTVKLKDFVNHDIRRTVRTQLSKLRVPSEIAELVIGHGRQGLEGTYNQHEALDERREALEKWAAHIQSLIAPREASNVIPLRSREA